MRTVRLPGFDRPVSVLGFGCASLGSRIGPRQGLRALEEAFEQGVNWFDVAPAYGAGDAEAILGRFLAGRRDEVMVCSKVGLAPPRRNGLMKLAYGLARPVAGALQGLRKSFRRLPATRNVSVPLTAEMIRKSIERSLERMGTDHLDVFALHKPRHEDITRDEVLGTLDSLRRQGLARHIAVSGDAQAARIALRHPEVYVVLQLADDPLDSPLPTLRPLADGRQALVTHSIFGVGGSLERLSQRLRTADPALRQRMSALGYEVEPTMAAAQLLLDRALAANDAGVVLLSMFADRHRAANLARTTCVPPPEAVELVATLLAEKPEAG